MNKIIGLAFLIFILLQPIHAEIPFDQFTMDLVGREFHRVIGQKPAHTEQELVSILYYAMSMMSFRRQECSVREDLQANEANGHLDLAITCKDKGVILEIKLNSKASVHEAYKEAQSYTLPGVKHENTVFIGFACHAGRSGTVTSCEIKANQSDKAQYYYYFSDINGILSYYEAMIRAYVPSDVPSRSQNPGKHQGSEKHQM